MPSALGEQPIAEGDLKNDARTIAGHRVSSYSSDVGSENQAAGKTCERGAKLAFAQGQGVAAHGDLCGSTSRNWEPQSGLRTNVASCAEESHGFGHAEDVDLAPVKGESMTRPLPT